MEVLNKNDLYQIAQLLDQKLDHRFGVFEKKFDKKLVPINKQLKVLKKNQGAILSMLDQEQVNQRKRIDRIEQHLDLPPVT